MFSFKDDTFKNTLAQKYAIAQQEANSGTTSSNAQMMNAQTMRQGMPSEIALRTAQARNVNTTTDWMPKINSANIKNTLAQAGLFGAQARNFDMTTNLMPTRVGAEVRESDERVASSVAARSPADEGMRRLYALQNGFEDVAQPDTLGFSGMPSAMQGSSPLSMGFAENDPRRYGYAKGIAKVPGKGSGKVDKVPAKLAPGEAVLNKAAAEMLGRGLIAKLNAKGAAKMGMV